MKAQPPVRPGGLSGEAPWFPQGKVFRLFLEYLITLKQGQTKELASEQQEQSNFPEGPASSPSPSCLIWAWGCALRKPRETALTSVP